MAILFGLNSFLQAVLLFVISLIFLRLVLWRIWRCKNLPPGPPTWPIVGNLLQIPFGNGAFHSSVKKFHERYGPIFTIWLGPCPLLIIASGELAHEALIQKGSLFSDRPPVRGMQKIFSSNQHSISTATYGPLWRSLRRNLVSEALSASAMKAFGEVREWGIGLLVENLKNEAARNGGAVSMVEHLRNAVFFILLWMCFGSKPDEETVISIQDIMREVILNGRGLDDVLPILGFFNRRRRARREEIRHRQRETLLALINQRRDASPPAGGAYVDTLFNLRMDGGRSLNDDELVTLCFEFITGGTDTTTTSVQWLMANLVIRQDIQTRLYDEIVGVTGKGKLADENDLQRMPYLDAVVKETLRRHPPAHFVPSHAVTRPCELAGYKVPTDAFINFDVAGIGMDPRVWPSPWEFKPERFVDEC